MRDPEVAQVRHERADVVEAHARPELQAVRRTHQVAGSMRLSTVTDRATVSIADRAL